MNGEVVGAGVVAEEDHIVRICDVNSNIVRMSVVVVVAVVDMCVVVGICVVVAGTCVIVVVVGM